MTKQDFLSGKPFRVGFASYKGAETYSYNQKDDYISKQVRSSIDETVVLEGYACNVLEVGRVGFTGFTFIMKKRVVVKYRFEDLVEFKEEA